jgi:hypothetical protein
MYSTRAVALERIAALRHAVFPGHTRAPVLLAHGAGCFDVANVVAFAGPSFLRLASRAASSPRRSRRRRRAFFRTRFESPHDAWGEVREQERATTPARRADDDIDRRRQRASHGERALNQHCSSTSRAGALPERELNSVDAAQRAVEYESLALNRRAGGLGSLDAPFFLFHDVALTHPLCSFSLSQCPSSEFLSSESLLASGPGELQASTAK